MRNSISFFLVAALVLFTCVIPNAPGIGDAVVECDESYPISGMYFDNDHELTFNVRLVKVVSSAEDSITVHDIISSDKGMALANEIYSKGSISFKYDSIELLVDSLYGGAMRDIHLIARRYNVRGFLNIYIFGDHFSTRAFGISGGAPSMYAGVQDIYVETTTLAHELGHCLGLHHTHSFDSSADGYTIMTGDLICDTPKNVLDLTSVDEDCEYMGKSRIGEDAVKVLVCNIMSYGHLGCRLCITQGQINRVRFITDQSMDLRSSVTGLPDLQEILY